jgi:hypothetical protein
MLTSLTLKCPFRTMPDSAFYVDLGHLTGLSHLEAPRLCWDPTHADVACLSSLTNLTSLDLVGCRLAGCVADSSALAPLVGLVSLGLEGDFCGMSLVQSLNVQAIQSLSLSEVIDDVSVLERAMGLTRLRISCEGDESYPHGLGPAIAKMSRLCSLRLSAKFRWGREPHEVFHLSPILPTLTCLTSLRFRGTLGGLGDIEACASLPALQCLWLSDTREVTPACVPILMSMTGFTALTLINTGIGQRHLTHEVISASDAERFCRGWPALELECKNYQLERTQSL